MDNMQIRFNQKQMNVIIKNLIKHLQSNKGFGTKGCQPICLDCPNCRGQMLIGLLEWYLDIDK